MFEIDRYALVMSARMQADVQAWYERYEFHPAVARLQTYCSEDLGAFYLDVLKDRLYTTGDKSLARRSAQTALWHITNGLLKLMAPILSFTAEEAWKHLHAASQPLTIFTEIFHVYPEQSDRDALSEKWARLREIRAEVMRRIEEVRSAGKVGSSLAAEIDIHAAGRDYEWLKSLGDDLRFVLIVSRATVHAAGDDTLRIEVQPTEQQKCERCWHHRADVGSNPDHPTLCGRCSDNLFGDGEERHHA